MTELSEAQRRMLRRLPGFHSITNSTLNVLRRRGLVTFKRNKDGGTGWYRIWDLTESGRAALDAGE